jgi:hypothetical protein
VSTTSPDPDGATALIDYLTRPETQIATARSVGFFPVVKADLPADLDPGIKLGAGAIEKTQTAKDALTALLPIGLGQHGGEFDKVFMDTFQLIVLRGQKPRAVLETQSAGRVQIGERDVSALAPRKRGLAMVFQNYAVFPHMTVRQNVGFGLRMAGADPARIERQVARVAALLHIEPNLDRYPAQLSGGQRQRVAVARALLVYIAGANAEFQRQVFSSSCLPKLIC